MREESSADRRWPLALGVLATLVQVLSVARALSRPGRPAMNVDSALFQHAGWYVTQGAVPYLDIWDIKPPLAIETTAFLAILVGGDPYRLHLLSVAVTAGAAVSCALLVFVLAHHLTENSRVAFLAALTPLTVPGFYYLSANGFRPKYLTLCLGLAALALQLRDRPLFAGVAAATSAGYWQYGGLFAIIVVGMTLEKRDRRALVRQLLGMALVTALVLAPIVLWGAVVPMLVEVLYVPLTTQGTQSVLQRLGKLLLYLAYALVPVTLGAYGLLADRSRLPRGWWVYLGAAFGGLQVLFDLDSAPDLYVLVMFLALGFALFVARAEPRTRRVLSVVLAAIVLVNAVWVGGLVTNPVGESAGNAGGNDTGDSGFGTDLRGIAESVDVSRPGEPPRHGIPAVRDLYWHSRTPPSCHYRLSGTERDWLAKTGRPYHESGCGKWD